MKKFFTLLLLALLPLVASAASDVEVDGIFYYFKNSGLTKTAEVRANPNKYTGDITIPATVTYNEVTYDVTSIGSKAFQECVGLTSVTIPNSVNSIGTYAFSGCSGLVSVTIPNSVTAINNRAFENCIGLVTVTLSDGIKTIGLSAFSGCSSLIEINLPSTVTSIGTQAFYNCENLKSIVIPEGVATIKECTFAYCGGLNFVTIPRSLTSIETHAFLSCEKLSEVRISDLEAWCNISFDKSYPKQTNPLTIAHHLILNGEEIKDLVIPETVTTLNVGVFYGGSEFTSITIPNTITSIPESAFRDCSGITSITLPEDLTMIKGNAFQGCSGLETIKIPSKVEYIYQEAFASCRYLKYIQSLSKTPPFLYDNSFSNFNVPVIVPSESVDAYKEAQGWKNFSTINDKTYYNLVYKVDETEYKTYNLEIGTVITSEEAPTKEGYTFSGWSKIPGTMPAEDVTVTGTFTVNKYKLTYQVDGEEYKSYEKEYGLEITSEEAPTKEGYTFSGWSEIPGTMPANDVTVTGTFTINKYKLIYQVDGEDYKTYDVEYGSSITPEAAPTKDGYFFLGWSEIPEKMPANDVTVTGTFVLQTSEDVIKITSAGQMTWCSAYDLDFTDVVGLKAYSATGYDRETGTIWLTRIFKVPANEGILLMGDPGEYKVPHKSTTTYYMNMFKGTLEDITINETDGDYTNYYLSNGDSGVGFYKVNGSIGIKAHRAYLPLLKGTTQAGTRFIGLGFEDDGTTNLTPALSKGEGAWYTLQGQRVAKPGKGLYIHNGKKVVIK